MAIRRGGFEAQKSRRLFERCRASLLHRELGLGRFQLAVIDGPHFGDTPLPRRLTPCLGRPERAEVDIFYSTLAERRGKGGLGEAGTARGGDGADVDQQRDARLAELAQQLVDRLPFIADGEQLQSKISSRKLFFRFRCGS